MSNKSKDISPTSPGTIRTEYSRLTDPDIAFKPSVVTPLSIPVGESTPGNLPAMDISQPPEHTTASGGKVWPRVGGDPNNLGIEPAPSTAAPYGVCTEYKPSASSLPVTVSAAEVASDAIRRAGGQ